MVCSYQAVICMFCPYKGGNGVGVRQFIFPSLQSPFNDSIARIAEFLGEKLIVFTDIHPKGSE